MSDSNDVLDGTIGSPFSWIPVHQGDVERVGGLVEHVVLLRKGDTQANLRRRISCTLNLLGLAEERSEEDRTRLVERVTSSWSQKLNPTNKRAYGGRDLYSLDCRDQDWTGNGVGFRDNGNLVLMEDSVRKIDLRQHLYQAHDE